MVVDFALAMLTAIDAGTVKSDFRGTVSGDAWISGVDSVDSWGPFLRATDLLDDNGLAAVMVPTAACDAAVARGDWQGAINAWGDCEGVVTDNTDDVGACAGGVAILSAVAPSHSCPHPYQDFYNILKVR